MKITILKFLCICWWLLNCHTSVAQEEERYERDTTEKFNEPPGNTHVLRLKKSYLLGDGIIFRSA